MTIRQLAGHVAIATLVAAGVLLGIWMIYRLQALVILVLIAIVLAAGIAPLVEKLERRRFPRAAAILLVYVLAFVVILGIGAFIGTIIVSQSIAFSQHLPEYMARAQKLLGDYQARYKWLPDFSKAIQSAPAQLRALGSRSLGAVPQIFGYLGSLISLLSILVINFYILMGREQLRDSFLAMVPHENRKHAAVVFAEMGRRMGGWLRGQLLLALIVGVVTVVVLWVLGVSYAGLIGLIAAIAELVPMVGAAVAMVPAILVTLIGGKTWQVIAVVIFFLLLAQTDSSYLTPRIMKSSVGLSPLATVLALLVGASLLGAVGALLAIPLAAALQVFFGAVISPAIRRAGEEHEE